MEKFKNKYRIPSNRLQGYDYGSHGYYFITICTKNRVEYFGQIVATGNCPMRMGNGCPLRVGDGDSMDVGNGDSMHVETRNCASLRASEIGKIAIKYWNEIPKHYPFVELDEFVIMPNHIHGILFFNCPDKTDWNPNQFGVQSKNLGAVIRAFKSSVKRYTNQNKIPFEWQPRYHDRIVRDDRELMAIRRYIKNNPSNWAKDKMNKPG